MHNCNCTLPLLTNSWHRVLVEKQTVTELPKQFMEHRFIIVFRKAYHCHVCTTHCRQIMSPIHGPSRMAESHFMSLAAPYFHSFGHLHRFSRPWNVSLKEQVGILWSILIRVYLPVWCTHCELWHGNRYESISSLGCFSKTFSRNCCTVLPSTTIRYCICYTRTKDETKAR